MSQHPPTTADSITRHQAANMLGVSIKTIDRMIARGELRAFRVGPRLVRIRRRDLDRLFRQVATATYAHVSGGDGVA